MHLSEIGMKIRELRKEKKLSQEELCKIAKISRPTLSKLERGYLASVSIVTVDAILSVLDYEICIEKRNPFFQQPSKT